MRILAFETSVSSFSVALLKDENCLQLAGSHSKSSSDSSQSEFLTLEIENLLKQNGIWYGDLDLIATCKGPGSFTGIRIALTAAKIIKITTQKPVIVLNSCEIVAYKNCHKSPKILVFLDAGAGEFFYAKFSSSKKEILQIGDIELLAEEKIFQKFLDDDFFICGSGKRSIAKLLSEAGKKFAIDEEDDEIDANLIGKVSYKKFLMANASSKERELDLNPLYIRSAKISERKK